MSVRVRFAPSPTGLLHVGALRTVLYDHLLAKKHGGQNILRIEDTDRERYIADSETEFVTTLRWVGIDFDTSTLALEAELDVARKAMREYRAALSDLGKH